jgi:hypothetical protein
VRAIDRLGGQPVNLVVHVHEQWHRSGPFCVRL